MFDKNLKKRLFNTYKFSNHDINKFILLLRKGVHPDEFKDDWQQFNETSLPEKKNWTWKMDLNIEDINDSDQTHAKRVCRDFEIKNLEENYDLYVHSNIFQNMS